MQEPFVGSLWVIPNCVFVVIASCVIVGATQDEEIQPCMHGEQRMGSQLSTPLRSVVLDLAAFISPMMRTPAARATGRDTYEVRKNCFPSSRVHMIFLTISKIPFAFYKTHPAPAHVDIT